MTTLLKKNVNSALSDVELIEFCAPAHVGEELGTRKCLQLTNQEGENVLLDAAGAVRLISLLTTWRDSLGTAVANRVQQLIADEDERIHLTDTGRAAVSKGAAS